LCGSIRSTRRMAPISPGNPARAADGIRLPKADNPELVEKLDTLLTEQEEKLGLDIGHFKIIPSIESAQGVLNCVERPGPPRVSWPSPSGGGLHRLDGIDRTKSGEELFSARNQVVWAAKAAGVQAIDSIFSDVSDMDALRAETMLVKRLGFTGKSLVNPRQIEIIHDVFRPTAEEIQHAWRSWKLSSGPGDGHGRHLHEGEDGRCSCGSARGQNYSGGHRLRHA